MSHAASGVDPSHNLDRHIVFCMQVLCMKTLEMQTWCRVNRVKRPPRSFSLNLIGWSMSRSVYPVLHSAVKAADTKTLIFWVANAAYHDARDDHSRLRAACAYGLADFHHTLEQHGDVLPHHAATRATRSAYIFIKAYQQLAADALRSQKCLWKIRPKMHYFVHMVDRLEASRRNPRSFQCYGDEDLMGAFTKIASATHRRTVMLRSLQRYTILVGQRWKSKHT